MNSKLDISIVIVNYNVKDFLYQCLNSIYKHSTSHNIQVIVVDNNSHDNSIEFLTNLFPQVEFIALNENLGFAKANNIGISKALGKYLLILNPDTIIFEDTFQVMYDFMEKNPKVGAAGCKVLNSDSTFQLACRRGFPSPWASFCKLFGLQTLFPKSKLFAQYNQTFRSVDESYPIDALIGAFMFCRKDVIDQVGGFDTEYFMYGEDLDLCFKINQANYQVYYVHNTSIIHFKGESTKRSSINEVKHFYEAMQIFAKKHYGKNFLFLIFLKIGIQLRLYLAYISKFKKDIFLILFDLIVANSVLLISCKIRWNAYFPFPEYAYPSVFIVFSLVLIFSMISSGEYFEGKSTIRGSFIGLMLSFFILSSLTYYFKDYAFSRGFALITIGLSAVIFTLTRYSISYIEKYKNKHHISKIAFLGFDEKAEIISKEILQNEKSQILGYITLNNNEVNKVENTKINILGSEDYLNKILIENDIDELILTNKIKFDSKTTILQDLSSVYGINTFLINSYDELIANRLMNSISSNRVFWIKYKINLFRFKALKRITDLLISLFTLTFGLAMLYLFSKNSNLLIKKLFRVIKGELSIVGLQSIDGSKASICKEGLISLAGLNPESKNNPKLVEKLNLFYIENYSFFLDLDILFNHLTGRKSGI